MNIALIAHDSKKELMVQFCIAYCGVLSRHNLCGTGTTGKLVSEATGLHIVQFLSGEHGGDQQIASRIACNEIDLLLFFRDPINPAATEPNDADLFAFVRCSQHSGSNQHRYGRSAHPRAGTRGFGLAQHCKPHPLTVVENLICKSIKKDL